MKRVVVTGLGVVSSIGNDLKTFWDSLENGVSGIGWVKSFDASEYYSKVAGEVKDFDPLKYMDRKEVRRNSRFVQFGVASSLQAMEDSGLKTEELDPLRAGVIYGVGMGGMGVLEEQNRVLDSKGPGRVSPFLITMTIPNMAAGTISIKAGFKGPSLTISTACASSTNAIGEAFKMIRNGDLDVAIAGGAESTVTPLAYAGFGALTALTTQPPETACRPFDKNRDGFTIAEGSATLILEEYEHAVKRGAKIYAEMVGYGSNDDAGHITAPDPEGKGAALAIKEAIDTAEINPDQVDYINAHGTSTPLNDRMESMAVKSIFGMRESLNISSTKSMHGHALGAAGAIEATATILAMKNKKVPPTINLKEADENCPLNYTPEKAVGKTIIYAMSNSFGFGGHNASILFKKL